MSDAREGHYKRIVAAEKTAVAEARSLAIDDAVKALDAVAPQVRAAIFAHVDATHIDTCVLDGINAEGVYSANVEARQRAYQDGIRVGRMSAAKAADAELAKLPSRLEALKEAKP